MEQHHIVTDEEYFEALPPKGLALSKEQLSEYLEQALQDSAYPKRDAVTGLLTIHTIQQSNEASA